jgi:hypothetical protein
MFGFKKIKPFYKNKSKEDFIKWFSETKPWNKLDLNIIEAIVNKFANDSEAFEIFEWVSQTCNLVANNYIPLIEKGSDDTDFTLSTFALTLYNVGNLYRDKLDEAIKRGSNDVKTISMLLNISNSSYESAIKLNQFCLGAYYQLAFLRGKIMNKNKDAIEYCKTGLAKIKELEGTDKSMLTLVQRATLDTIGNTKELFNAMLIEFEEK